MVNRELVVGHFRAQILSLLLYVIYVFLSICGTEKCYFGLRYVLWALFFVTLYHTVCMFNTVLNNQASFPGYSFRIYIIMKHATN